MFSTFKTAIKSHLFNLVIALLFIRSRCECQIFVDALFPTSDSPLRRSSLDVRSLTVCGSNSMDTRLSIQNFLSNSKLLEAGGMVNKSFRTNSWFLDENQHVPSHCLDR